MSLGVPGINLNNCHFGATSQDCHVAVSKNIENNRFFHNHFAKMYLYIPPKKNPALIKNPDPSKVAILRTPKHHCYAGSFTLPLGGPRILRVPTPFQKQHQQLTSTALRVAHGQRRFQFASLRPHGGKSRE